MTIRHFKIFITVCECGGVTAAGEKLFIAQPSVSLAISETEDYYGVKLFDRISRKLYLTEVGKQFLEYTKHIVSLYDEMESRIKNWGNIGVLRVGASVTPGTFLLPKYVKHFKKNHPNVEIFVTVDTVATIEKMLLNNEIDFALVTGIISNTSLLQFKFMHDEHVLICNKDHRFAGQASVNIEELKNEDFILSNKKTAVRDYFDSIMMINGIDIVPIWQSSSVQSIIQGVLNGLGISMVSLQLLKEHMDNENLHIFKISNMTLNDDFSIVYHKNKFLPELSQEFIKLCISDELL